MVNLTADQATNTKLVLNDYPVNILQRECACGRPITAGGECKECRKKRLSLQRRAVNQSGPEVAPPIVHEVLRSPGLPLDTNTRTFMESRFEHDFGQVRTYSNMSRSNSTQLRISSPSDHYENEANDVASKVMQRSPSNTSLSQVTYDFSKVRVHTGIKAANSAQQVNALAYTVGQNIVFGEGQYAPDSVSGRQLIAHELTHVLQQSTGKKHIIQREPTFPDNSCSAVEGNIEAAWPIAKAWVAQANRRLEDPSSVAGDLMQHFKIDPENPAHAGDLATVRQVFSDAETLFDRAIDNTCTPPNQDDECSLPDGREYAAWVHAGQPEDGITHCLTSAEAGALSRQSLANTLVHEMAHLADPQSTDHAYRHQDAYEGLRRQQAIRNAECYSEFAREQFTSLGSQPLFFGFGTGLHLTERGAAWAVTASENFRSRTGLEVIDLVGGVHLFLAIDPNTDTENPVEVIDLGVAADIGFQSRSPDTRFLADFRVGGFISGRDLTQESSLATGVTTNLLLGWADNDFRAGVNLRMLFDVLNNNHAMIIGGQFSFGL